MANPWFKMHADFYHDPKVQTMSEAMQRRLLMLFCLRCSDELDCLADDEIRCALRISARQWQNTRALFIEKGFIDEDLNVCNWNKRQHIDDETGQSAEDRRREKDRQRLKGWRAKQREGQQEGQESKTDETPTETFHETLVKRGETQGETQGETVSETPMKRGETTSDTDTETDTETENNTHTPFQLETAAQDETLAVCVDPKNLGGNLEKSPVAKPEKPPPDPEFPYGDPRPAGKLAKLLRGFGVQVSPQNPDFCQWVENGLDADEITVGVEIARHAKPKPAPIPWGYLAKVLTSQRKVPSGHIPAKPQDANPWDGMI